MKKVLVLCSLLFASVLIGFGQTSVRLTGNSGSNITDGSTCTLTWSYTNAPAAAVAEISLVGLIGGSESFAYPLTDTEMNGPSGKLVWVPRVLRGSGEQYLIRVTWKTALIGTLLSTNQTRIYTMLLPAARSISSLSVSNTGILINNYPLLKVSWNSNGLPPNARIQLLLQPQNNPNGGSIEVAMTSDVGSYLWWQDPKKYPVGNYYLNAYYVTEYGVYGAESPQVVANIRLAATIGIADPITEIDAPLPY